MIFGLAYGRNISTTHFAYGGAPDLGRFWPPQGRPRRRVVRQGLGVSSVQAVRSGLEALGLGFQVELQNI